MHRHFGIQYKMTLFLRIDAKDIDIHANIKESYESIITVKYWKLILNTRYCTFIKSHILRENSRMWENEHDIALTENMTLYIYIAISMYKMISNSYINMCIATNKWIRKALEGNMISTEINFRWWTYRWYSFTSIYITEYSSENRN